MLCDKCSANKGQQFISSWWSSTISQSCYIDSDHSDGREKRQTECKLDGTDSENSCTNTTTVTECLPIAFITVKNKGDSWNTSSTPRAP